MASERNNRGDQGQPSTSAKGSYLGQDQLARQLSYLARNLQREESLQHTLSGIVRAVVDNVPGAQFAGAFNDESEHVGLLLASHAAVAMASAQR
jgi:hypothetical protein